MSKISDYFNLEYGKFKDPFGNLNEGKTPFISSGDSENGVVGFFEVHPIYKNVISVARTGSVGSSFYHPYSCLVNSDCIVLSPKKEYTAKEMLTFTYFLNKNRYRYSYARKVTPQRLGETEIPPKLFEVINLDIPSIEKLSKPYHQKHISLQDREWQWFGLSKLFEIENGKSTVSKDDITTNGKYSIISSTTENNGVQDFTDLEPEYKENSFTLSIRGGGKAFYQPKPFLATLNAMVLQPKFICNQYIGVFLANILSKDSYRYHYGRIRSMAKVETEKIKLPINSQNQPDWEFMEDYIKSLPYSVSL